MGFIISEEEKRIKLMPSLHPKNQNSGMRDWDILQATFYLNARIWDVQFFESHLPYLTEKPNQDDQDELSTVNYLGNNGVNWDDHEHQDLHTQESRGSEGRLENETPRETEQIEENAGEDQTEENEGEEQNEMLGRGARQKFEPYWRKDYACKSTWIINPTKDEHQIVQSESKRPGTRYPLDNYVNTNCFSELHRNFLAAIDKIEEPRNYYEAARDPKWCDAMRKEIDALEKNGTWKIVSIPHDKKPIGCKWVYKVKYKADGTIERYKARLVTQGFT
ncbi:uncharacterized protein LOC141649248 [Silene latifolia]|uniref:uncharacterized protein LOC141649248 n=1 Tax=Silene latifolia TaxID=37657 RepID=UPI003D789061